MIFTEDKLYHETNNTCHICSKSCINKVRDHCHEFREEIVTFVRDKKELDLELILDKRCKTNILNTLGNKCLAECITSKDNTKDLIEIMAKYYL